MGKLCPLLSLVTTTTTLPPFVSPQINVCISPFPFHPIPEPFFPYMKSGSRQQWVRASLTTCKATVSIEQKTCLVRAREAKAAP